MKDERLFMRFPITFGDDPKIAVLSDSAFRAFVEMNGYSRQLDLDGVIPSVYARHRWGKAVAELAEESDLIMIDEEAKTVTIAKYAKHQFTTEDREKLHAAKSDAGRKGNAKRWQKDRTDIADASQVRQETIADASQTIAESESESEGLLLTTHSQSHQSNAHANETDGLNIGRVRTAVGKHLGILDVPSVAELEALAADLIARAPKKVRSREAYIEGCDGESVRAAWDRVKTIRASIVSSLGEVA